MLGTSVAGGQPRYASVTAKTMRKTASVCIWRDMRDMRSLLCSIVEGRASKAVSAAPHPTLSPPWGEGRVRACRDCGCSADEDCYSAGGSVWSREEANNERFRPV